MFRIGVDVGGTFTDLVLLRDDGSIVLEKSPTTPADQSDGVMAGLDRLAVTAGVEGVTALLAATETIVHGTTTGDNTMIQMKGAPTGLLVTEGFRDEIELRRCFKEDIWDPALPAPEPIARRRVRLEIPERLTAEGEVDTPLDEDAVRHAIRRLAAFGVTSIAIVFVHSYANPAHELRARELVLEEYPDVELISLSHEVYPKPPEFERTSTTLVNAYVGPPIVGYLTRLEGRLRESGYGGRLLLATCAGGVATPEALSRRAVATIGSGPTGGVVAASRGAATAGLGDVVSVDMGGTSYDVCLIRDGRPEITSDWNWRHRYCIALPMIDIHAIGAGGGSIAHVDGGTLRVGPGSAGSDPGPACYGLGGTEPTVTDADLVLGRIDPAATFPDLGRLDTTAAGRALERASVDAAGVAAVVDAAMEQAVRRVTVERGVDPRALALVAFGGAGPLHACAIADALGMPAVIVPPRAGVLSAVGILGSPRSRELVRTWPTPLDHTGLDRALAALGEEARALVEPDATLTTLVDCRYPGQSHDLSVGRVEEFHAEHELRNGFARPHEQVEVVALRARAVSEAPLEIADLPVPREPHKRVDGPVAIAEPDCTIWVAEGWRAEVGALGAWILRRTGAPR